MYKEQNKYTSWRGRKEKKTTFFGGIVYERMLMSVSSRAFGVKYVCCVLSECVSERKINCGISLFANANYQYHHTLVTIITFLPLKKPLTVKVDKNRSEQKDAKHGGTNPVIVRGCFTVSNFGGSPVEGIQRIHHDAHGNDSE